MYAFCLEEDLCNALCNACGATLSLCHSSMLWHRKRTQPCLSDTMMEQGHFLLHQTVIHSKTAVNSHPRHTLRTGTVNDINLRMTQFWKTLHTVLLLTYHLAAQVSHSHVRQVKMWWIRKVYSLTSCTQMSKLWVTVAKSSTLFTRFMVRFILFNPASHWVKRTEDPHSAAATPLIYHQHNLYT